MFRKRFGTKQGLAAALALLMLVSSILFIRRPHASKFVLSPCGARQTLIIDAGHGGEDGGAVSVSGRKESEINLSIARRMDALLGFMGVSPVMLRTEDVSLHDPDCNTIRKKKVSDLKNRVKQINGIPNGILFSIHQNTYPSASLHGAQVFFADKDNSFTLAQLAQETLRVLCDEQNKRKASHIPDSVYLMNHVTCPAILVECGFLSNPEEDALLQTDAYQIKIALALVSTYLDSQALWE